MEGLYGIFTSLIEEYQDNATERQKYLKEFFGSDEKTFEEKLYIFEHKNELFENVTDEDIKQCFPDLLIWPNQTYKNAFLSYICGPNELSHTWQYREVFYYRDGTREEVETFMSAVEYDFSALDVCSRNIARPKEYCRRHQKLLNYVYRQKKKPWRKIKQYIDSFHEPVRHRMKIAFAKIIYSCIDRGYKIIDDHFDDLTNNKLIEKNLLDRIFNPSLDTKNIQMVLEEIKIFLDQGFLVDRKILLILVGVYFERILPQQMPVKKTFLYIMGKLHPDYFKPYLEYDKQDPRFTPVINEIFPNRKLIDKNQIIDEAAIKYHCQATCLDFLNSVFYRPKEDQMDFLNVVFRYIDNPEKQPFLKFHIFRMLQEKSVDEVVAWCKEHVPIWDYEELRMDYGRYPDEFERKISSLYYSHKRQYQEMISKLQDQILL